jgi:hypothetical protein
MADNEIVYGVRVDASGAKSGAQQVSQAFNQEMAQAGGGSSAANSVTQFGTAFAQQMPGLSSAFSLITKFAGPVGIAGIAAGAIKGAWSMGEMSNSLERTSKTFLAFNGSATEARVNLEAVQGAVKGALGDDEAMTAATTMLSLGVAKNSTDLRQLSRDAILLGQATMEPVDAIQSFAELLSTGSVRGLKQFGISSTEVTAKQKELQAATADLSAEEAKRQAILSIADAQANRIAAQLGEGAKASTRFKVAWQELREEIGKGLGLGGGVSGITNYVSTAMEQAKLDLAGNPKGYTGGPEQVAYFNAQNSARDAQNRYNEEMRTGDTITQGAALSILNAAKAHEQVTGAAYAAALAEGAAADAADAAATGTGAYASALSNTVGMLNNYIAGQSAANDELARWNGLRGVQDALGQGMAAISAAQGMTTFPNAVDLFGPADPRGQTQALIEVGNKTAIKQYEKQAALDKQLYDQGVSLAKQQAEKAVSDWKSAVDKMQAAFTSAMDKVKSNLDKAMGVDSDPLAPGNNGPFEPLYRIADVYQNLGKKDFKEYTDNKGVKHTAKESQTWAAQYYPGMSPAEQKAAAGADLATYRNAVIPSDLAPLYKSGILSETNVNSYFAKQQADEAKLAGWQASMGVAVNPYAGRVQFGMTGMPGAFPLGAAGAGAIKPGAGAIAQPGAGIAQGLGNDIFQTPLVAQLNALQNNALFLKASEGVGTKAAKTMSDAWLKEMPNTPWASGMAAAILASLNAEFDKPK